MNKKDKERLEELSISIWAQLCERKIVNSDNDYGIVFKDSKGFYIKGEKIEPHDGRRKKALRLLSKAGVISGPEINKDKNYKEEIFYINKLENAEKYGVPVNLDREQLIEDEISGVLNSYDNASKEHFMFISFSSLSHEERIYTYFNQHLYNIRINHNIYVYPKEKETKRKILLLKTIVERELNRYYPIYLNIISDIKTENKDMDVEWKFLFKNYTFLDMMNLSKLESLLDNYKKQFNFIKNQLNDLNQTEKSIKKIGGHEKAIEKIRKFIIENMLKEKDPIIETLKYRYFPTINEMTRKKDKTYKWSSKIAIAYKDLFQYDILYKNDTSIYMFNINEWSWRDEEYRTFDMKEDTGYEKPKSKAA
ncbi:MAG: hypothetical protein GF317_15755 [Candidatus Lokiarchaeota archaeon]|nr:hypothetical protein [Candidatus Lokiarchaeota archaeon]